MKPTDLTPNEVVELGQERINLSREYYEYLEQSYEAKRKLDTLLASKLKDIRERKSNVGYDMAILMLMEDSEDAVAYNKDWKDNQAKYKGLEKIIEAIGSQVSLFQSIWKADR